MLAYRLQHLTSKPVVPTQIREMVKQIAANRYYIRNWLSISRLLVNT